MLRDAYSSLGGKVSKNMCGAIWYHHVRFEDPLNYSSMHAAFSSVRWATIHAEQLDSTVEDVRTSYKDVAPM